MSELYKHSSELWAWISENITSKEDSENHNYEVDIQSEEDLNSTSELNVPKEFVLLLNDLLVDIIVKSLDFCLTHQVIRIDSVNISSLMNRENIEVIIKNNIEDIIKSVTIIRNDPNYQDMAGIENSEDLLNQLVDDLLECKRTNSLIEYSV